jgi:uncharacterized protein YhbP (UPF0306 family)
MNFKWNEEENKNVIRLLEACRTLVLSTSNESGEPSIAPVYFSLAEGPALDFVSKNNTQHILNLKHHSGVAGAVFQEGHSLTDITGLQMKGEICCLKNQAESTARKDYLVRFPSLNQNLPLLALFHTIPLFRFTPTWIRMTDHQPTGIRKREWTSS